MEILLRKFAGYAGGIIACFSKLPIIINIFKAGNCAGLSELSIYLDTSVYLSTTLYNFSRGNNFYTYGDVVATVAQNLIITFMILFLGPVGQGMSWQHIATFVVVALLFVYIVCALLQNPELYYLLILYAGIVPIFSKGSQIIKNFRVKKAGVQSMYSALNSALGPVLKIYYALVDSKDSLLLFSASVHLVLNVVLLYQLVALKKNKKD